MFLCSHTSVRRAFVWDKTTDRPRAPCFNSIRRTRCVSEVSKVTIRWNRSAGLICELQSKLLMWIKLSASEIIANVRGEFENIRNFSSLEYAST